MSFHIFGKRPTSDGTVIGKGIRAGSPGDDAHGSAVLRIAPERARNGTEVRVDSVDGALVLVATMPDGSRHPDLDRRGRHGGDARG